MTIEDRCENWGHQYRDRKLLGSCFSIEGRMYKSPWRQWCLYHEIPIPIVVDWRDAEVVEIGWVALPHGRYKNLLKFWYMTKMPDHVISRKCRFPIWRLPVELKKAHNMLEITLDRLKYSEIIDTQFDPRKREKQAQEPVLARPKETVSSPVSLID